jgi:hypothetical protein
MKLTDKYRPKADRALLHKLNDLAWQEISDKLAERVQTKIGAVLAAHLENLYPPADMEFLSQYDCASTRDEAHIQVRLPDGERWEHHVSIELPKTIQVPRSYNGLFAGGPRFSRQKNRGVNAKTRAEIEAGECRGFANWEAFCADQDASEARRVPEEIEPFLYEIVETKQAYRRDYRRLETWTAEWNRMAGDWPTWEKIADEFPVVGEKIKLTAFTTEAHKPGCGTGTRSRALDRIDGDPTNNDLANLRIVTLKANL